MVLAAIVTEANRPKTVPRSRILLDVIATIQLVRMMFLLSQEGSNAFQVPVFKMSALHAYDSIMSLVPVVDACRLLGL